MHQKREGEQEINKQLNKTKKHECNNSKRKYQMSKGKMKHIFKAFLNGRVRADRKPLFEDLVLSGITKG